MPALVEKPGELSRVLERYRKERIMRVKYSSDVDILVIELSNRTRVESEYLENEGIVAEYDGNDKIESPGKSSNFSAELILSEEADRLIERLFEIVSEAGSTKKVSFDRKEIYEEV